MCHRLFKNSIASGAYEETAVEDTPWREGDWGQGRDCLAVVAKGRLGAIRFCAASISSLWSCAIKTYSILWHSQHFLLRRRGLIFAAQALRNDRYTVNIQDCADRHVDDCVEDPRNLLWRWRLRCGSARQSKDAEFDAGSTVDALANMTMGQMNPRFVRSQLSPETPAILAALSLMC